MAKTERKALMVYFDWIDAIETLAPSERWPTLAALVEYSRYGAVPELEGAAKMLFTLAKPIIDHDREKYEHRCRVNAENGAKNGNKGSGA